MWRSCKRSQSSSFFIPDICDVKLWARDPRLAIADWSVGAQLSVYMSYFLRKLVRFSNRTCRSCKTLPFYLLKWVWAKLNNTFYGNLFIDCILYITDIWDEEQGLLGAIAWSPHVLPRTAPGALHDHYPVENCSGLFWRLWYQFHQQPMKRKRGRCEDGQHEISTCCTQS